MKKKELHIYVRVSSAEQAAKGHSLNVQEQRGREAAKRLSLTPKIFREEGKSANYEDTLNRPQLTALLDLCSKGKVTDIFVTDIDRLTRNLRLVLDMERIFLKNEITIHTLSSTLDLEDPDQRFHAIIQSVFAEHENRKRVRKIKQSLQRAVENGKWIGVNCPFGYRKDETGILEIDLEEAEVYKKMVDMTLKGMGTNTIAKELNRLQIPTKSSKVLKKGITLPKNHIRYHQKFIPKDEVKWAPNTIRSILLNPIHKGERIFKGQVLAVPAIIDEETWDRVQAQHKKNKNHSSTQRKYFYMLKNLLRCGHCERNLVGRIKPKPKDREFYYQCSGKRHGGCVLRSPNIFVLDAFVWNAILYFPKILQFIVDQHRKGDNTEIDSLEVKRNSITAEIEKLKSQQKRLMILFETERITLQEFDNRQGDLKSEMDRLQNELARVKKDLKSTSGLESRLQNLINELGNPLQYLMDLSPQEKREILMDMVENIQVTWRAEANAHLVSIEIIIEGVHFMTSKMMGNSKEDKEKILAGPGFQEQDFLDMEIFRIKHHGSLDSDH